MSWHPPSRTCRLKKSIPIIGVIVLSITLVGHAQGPTLEWAMRTGAAGASSIGESVDVDAAGNVYTAGRFTGTVDFDPGAGSVNLTSAGSEDAFITKMDPSGNLIWAKRVGGTQGDYSFGNAVDGTGVYLTGSFAGTADFDPGTGVFNLTAPGGFIDDIFILKLDPDGNFLWAKRIGASGLDFGHSIAVGSSGVVTTGSFEGTVDFDPGPGTASLAAPAGQDEIFILKLDASGNYVWAKRMGGTSGDFGRSIALDASESIYATGFFRGTADFDPGPATFNLTDAGNSDIFVSKLDASGNFVWAKRMGGTDSDRGASINVDLAGNVYTTGDFHGTADFDPGAGTSNLVSAGFNDSFVSKLDASGNFIWVKRIGGDNDDEGSSLSLDGAGNVYSAGLFQSSIIDLDPGPGTFNVTPVGSGDVFITKLDPSGNFVWGVTFGASTIHVNVVGRIYTTGYFSNTVDFDPGAGVSNLTAAGTRDIFVSKLNQALVPPTIASFTPSSGPVGTSVTINGTDFSSEPIYNIVYFGATRAVVTSATATQVTVTVPVGATFDPISVTTGGAIGYSSQPFLVTFPDGLINTCSFDPVVGIGSGSQGYDVAVGDLDGDGKTDIAVPDNPGGVVRVYRNISTAGSLTAGSFAASLDLASDTNPTFLEIAEIDGDGKLDLIVTNNTSNTLSIFRNTSTPGNISFAVKVDLATNLGPYQIATGDLNGDGRTDIAIANANSGGVSIWENIGSAGSITAASFAPKFDIPMGFQWVIAISDLDLDGKADLISGPALSTTLTVFRNINSGGPLSLTSFAPGVNFTVGTWPEFIAVGDLDNDGKPDIVTTSWPDTQLSVLRNTSTPGTITIGSFAPRITLPTGSEPRGVDITDFNGDGRAEIALANQINNQVWIYKNQSTPGVINTGSFATPVGFTAGGNLRSVKGADFDGDGKPDLAVSNWSIPSLTVLRNDVLQLPDVTGYSTGSADPGDPVSLTGSGFSPVIADNIVYFGATRATVNSATSSQLDVTVPHGATYERATVQAGCHTDYSRIPFVPTFEGNGVVNAATFLPKVDFTTGASSRPTDVELADFNGDGLADAVTINDQNNTVSVFRNTGSPGTVSFGPRVDLATGSSSQSIEVGDIDGDGKLDIITVSDGSAQMAVHRNTSTLSTISFAARVPFSSGAGSVSVAVGDLDGDGKTDVVVGRSGGTIAVFLNTGSIGTINFAALQSFATGSNTYSVAISDLDGDNKADVIASNRSSNNASVFRNNSSPGALAFDPRFDLTTSTQPHGIAAGDLDLDGKPEIVTCNYTTRTISVFRNISTSGSLSAASFAARVDLSNGATGNPTYVAIGDINGDGRPEILVGNDNGTLVQVHKNISSPGSITTGSFEPKVDYTTGTRPYNVISGDVDNDGKPDLVVASATSNNLTILRNASCLPAPTITNFSPTTGAIGDPVTITGTNFSPIPGNNLVAFNGVPAVVTVSTPTSITTSVPSGATTGLITVTVDCNTASSATNFVVTCDVPSTQKNALVALYNATNGTTWTTNTNWPTGNATTWYGITTDASCNVIQIDLDFNNLVGTIPPEIGDLTEMTHLSLSSNQLSGTLPDEITNLSNLEYLFIDNNNISGPLPATMGNMTSLIGLGTQVNAFTGPIPASLANCTELRNLHLESNQHTGSIPSFLGTSNINLQSINLGFNLFDGVIPPELGNLGNLSFLSLAENDLYGEIPPELGDLDQLGLLDLSRNQLYGNIPLEIGNCTNLNSLQLWDNQLTGSIPQEIDNLTNLMELNLSQNFLSGNIPGWTVLPNLWYVNFSNNILDGDLPSSLGTHLAIEELYLNNNFLSNDIPQEIADLPLLRIIDISSNLFTEMRAFSSVNLTDLVVANNSLDFGDLELNMGVANYSYDPQAKLPPGGQITFTLAGTLTIPFSTPGTGNQYQWYQGVNPVPGATSATLVKPGMTLADAGFYTLQITSTIVPGIILESRNYVVTSDPCGPGGPDGANDPSFVPDIGGSDDPGGVVEIQSTGKVIVSALGNVWNSTNIDGVFRLNTDGTYDNTFTLYPSFNPVMLVQPDDKILIVESGRPFRLEEDGALDEGFNDNVPSYYNSYTSALAVQPDGKILACISEDGGGFVIYRLNDDGTNDPTFIALVGDEVNVMAIQPNGKVVIGGQGFTGLRRVNADGSFDTSFNESSSDATISDFVLQPDGKIVIVGMFTEVNGAPYYRVARINSDGSTDTGFNAQGITDLLEDNHAPNKVLLQPDGKIILAGDFNSVNGATRVDIVRLNPDGTLDCTFDSGTGSDGGIQDAVLQPDGKVVIVGGFDLYGGVARDQFARVTNGGPTILINPHPANAIACEGTTALFATSATGTTNITYQWQYSPDGVVPYVDISNDPFYSNVTTSTLGVVADPYPEGFYRCKIDGDLATTVYTNAASLLSVPLPFAPSTTGAGRCGGGSVTLNASGGTNGEYRWYTVSTGGTALTGEVNSTYSTPVITATTTYYVSLHNGTCESLTRTAVTATINNSPPPPSTTSASGCVSASLTLTATGGINGQYRWYTVASGGTALVGEVNDTYTTPVLSTTTTYHVAINDGTCESTRTPVTATITLLGAPAVTISNCTATGATLNGPAGFATYTWSNGGSTPSINVALAGSYTLVVIDAGGCTSPSSTPVVFTSAFCNQPPVLQPTTVTTTIEGMVTIDLSALATDLDNNVDLSTLQVIQQPISGAVALITPAHELIVDYTDNPFVGTDELTIRVCDMAGACGQEIVTIEVNGDIKVYNALSPNGDGKNDTFIIQYIDALPGTQKNKVTILNRWGTVVFEVTDYNNTSVVFSGLGNNGTELPSGTYYYILEFTSGQPKRTGFISLRR